MKALQQTSDPTLQRIQHHLSSVTSPVPPSQVHECDEEGGAAAGCVSAAMTRKVVCVLESTPIEQVASLCNQRSFSGVPVVSDTHRLLGIVTLSDILRQLLGRPALSTFSQVGGEVLEQKALGVLAEPVRDFMQRNVITVEPDDSVRTACRKMRQHGIKRVVVTSGDRIRGIFSASDAVAVLADQDFQLDP